MTTAPECPHGLVAGECASCIANGATPTPLEYEFVGPGPAPTRGICRLCRGRFKEGDPVIARRIAASGILFGYLHPDCHRAP